MPLQIFKTLDDLTRVAVWNITEPLSYFHELLRPTEQEKPYFEDVSEKKSLERFCSRYLLKLLTGRKERIPCVRDEKGKPYMVGEDKHISISHSGPYIAVAMAEAGVGVDIQVMHEKIHRIAPKFVNQAEFAGIFAPHKKEQLHLIWGAKECMYKAYGKRALRFSDHMQLNGIDTYTGQGKMTGILSKNDFKLKYQIRYRKIGDAMFVLATEDSKT